VDDHGLTIAGLARAYRSGTLSSEETVSAVLQRIERAESGDEALGAFVTLCPEQALAAAAQADTDLRRGVDRSPLQGVPVAVKDILATRDMRTSAQSNAFTPTWDNDYEADAVRRLRDAGAVIVGKTTTSEFAIGLPDPQTGFPLPRNPWAADRWAGGSSAGSASGLAAGLFAGALGTDTGGSIRVPAAFCGVTGFKPSFDVVSRGGCLPLSKTLDHIGPLARTAEDCSLLMAAIARSGGWTAPNLEMPPGSRAVIGVPRFDEQQLVGVDPAALTILDGTIATLRDSGFETRVVEVPWFAPVADAVNVVMQCEALQVHSKNLER
jgi:aspartyl-tRNA(Asn)/glutamyl-tRNA(Gln) amidotransferase subunit A